PKSPIAEAYRSIRTNIQFSKLDNEMKTIVITSSKQDEGKTTVASNLAVSFASLEGKRVLLIDADLRNPSVHKMFTKTN
ncbi:P-loop NTPase, partial [bacterium 210820-DFI.6.52]|nr:P-loop NTPase [bacterium 210820-DFI.6.52]